MNGIILLYKPKGITSHQAVNFLRRKLGIKRIGHTGTLDPNVAGILPICVGRATRVSEYILNDDKEYIGELTLGKSTTTQDLWGDVKDVSYKVVSIDYIQNIFKKYKGEIIQTPPMYSAVKHKGRKLYELAREGKIIERKSRKIIIYDNEILKINQDKVLFKVNCSKGTYIRTLCNDIGEKLGTYGYMSYLIRTKVGNFDISKAISIESIKTMDREEIKKILLPMDLGIRSLDKVYIPDNFFDKISNGMKIYYNFKGLDRDKEYMVYCKGKFIGIGKFHTNDGKTYLKMRKVLIV